MSSDQIILSNITIETSITSVYIYIVIGIASIIFGFLGSGRDGLMFDTRVVRGLHRLPWPIMMFFFGVYSILLSVSQWSINENNSYCHMNINQFDINNKCSGDLNAVNILWYIILITESLYITTFLYQQDFRSAITNKDRLMLRSVQKKQFIISLVINFISIALHIPRFASIVYLRNAVSIALSITVFLFISIRTIVHIKAILLTAYAIRKFSNPDINDLTSSASSALPSPVTSSDSDEEEMEITTQQRHPPQRKRRGNEKIIL